MRTRFPRQAGQVTTGRGGAPDAEAGPVAWAIIIQRAVEEEFDSWLGRARYERRLTGRRGSATGFARGALRRRG